MTNGNALSGITGLVGTAGTILLAGVALREVDRISRPRSRRKRRRVPTRISKLTNI